MGVYYLHLFVANDIVGWLGGYLDTMPILQFWLMHAGIAVGGDGPRPSRWNDVPKSARGLKATRAADASRALLLHVLLAGSFSLRRFVAVFLAELMGARPAPRMVCSAANE